MRLEVDIGNTRIKWRLKEGDDMVERGFLVTGSSLALMEPALDRYLGKVKAIWVASVVDEELERGFAIWAKRVFSIEPLFVKSCASIGVVRNAYISPESLGVDRWLGILAAYHLEKRACIVLSLGTAATVDVVDKSGAHLGGFIAPGLSLMIGSLTAGTRRLSVVPAEMVQLDDGLGVSTFSAICGGCTSMLIGLVNNAITQLRKCIGNDDFGLVFAGGDAIQLIPYFPSARLMNDLVLDGLVYAMQGLEPLEE